MGLALLNGEPKNGKMDREFGENRDVERLCLPRLSPWLVARFLPQAGTATKFLFYHVMVLAGNPSRVMLDKTVQIYTGMQH